MSFATTKIKFGLNIIYDRDFYSAIDFATKYNFDVIEVWLGVPQFFPEKYSKKERKKIVNYTKLKDIQIQLHAPEYPSLFAYHSEIRKASLSYLKTVIDFAKDLESTVLTIHPGSIGAFTFPDGKKVPLFRSYPEYFLKIFRENLEALCNFTKNKTKLCMENTDYFETPLMKIIEEFLSKNKLYLTWDVAKSYNRDGTIKKQELNFFLKNMKSIKNIHLHDATSISGHEIIGRGFVDFKFFFKKLKNLDVNYIIEVRPHSNVLKSRNNLLKILR
jgi:sugar phosphate isomerase/epimerase